MARLPELVILRAPQNLGAAVAQVLVGLGRQVLCVPHGQASLALLPRLPLYLRERLAAVAQAAVDQWIPHNTLHGVEPGNPWWQEGVRYSDTSGTTLALHAQRNLPPPDAAPKWQNWFDVSGAALPDAVVVSTAQALELRIRHRWLRGYVYSAPQGSQKSRVVRWLDLRPDPVDTGTVVQLHPLQLSLGLIAWSRHDAAGCRGGLGELAMQVGSESEFGKPLERMPWQVWSQSAVLARGSAWWYDACGELDVRAQGGGNSV